MDPESAEPASSRRSLIGALGVAGLASAAALAAARPAAAAPFAPTAEDADLLSTAMGVELAARDLYLATLDAGIGDDLVDAVQAMASNHSAYADAIAGTIGASADARNDELFDSLESSFATSDATAFATAANGLENSLVATHTELLGDYESVDAMTLTGSIIVVEARMATVLANVAGMTDDIDALLEPESEPLEPSGGAS